METCLFVTLGESTFAGPLTFTVGGLLSVDCDGTYSQYMLCSSVGSMYVIITVGYAIEPILYIRVFELFRVVPRAIR